jgi:hypothetical protein
MTASMLCVTPGSAERNESSSRAKISDCTTSILEEKKSWLNQCVDELDSSNHVDLIRKIDALAAEVSERLSFRRHDQQQTAQIGTTVDSVKSRIQRVQNENSEISRELSEVINNFISRPSLADRRKFPFSRLAKIVVLDSILSFEWTHCEAAAKFSSDAYDNDGDGNVWSTPSKLFDVNLKRHGDKSKAAILVDSMWDETFLDGEVQLRMIQKVRCYLRNTVFTPWKILKAMDLAGFNLSLAGIEVLRRVGVAGKYMRGIIPSKSTILRSARKVEAAAAPFCPFTMIGRTFRDEESVLPANDSDADNEIGEGFEFDAIKVTKTLFEAFGLAGVSKRRPVELGLASDGAQLTNTISHVAAGLKFNDMAMCDPITRSPLLLHSPDSLVQSRNLCFPLHIVIAKDNKKTLEGFRSLYKKFSNGEVATALQCKSF